jgi:hypothetical protein
MRSGARPRKTDKPRSHHLDWRRGHQAATLTFRHLNTNTENLDRNMGAMRPQASAGGLASGDVWAGGLPAREWGRIRRDVNRGYARWMAKMRRLNPNFDPGIEDFRSSAGRIQI